MSEERTLKAYVDTIEDYVKLVVGIKSENEKRGKKTDLLFRGQSSDKPLLPRIARPDLNLNGTIRNVENLILNEFKRGMLPLSEFKPDNKWDLIALAQHHGLPTRYLDWTYNALIALWFAVEKPPIKNSKGKYEDGVVWIFSPDKDDFTNDLKRSNPSMVKKTLIFRSSVVSRRISAQAGLFTVHGIQADERVVKFEENIHYKDKLTPVTIPYEEFSKIRKGLNIHGVNNFTVYPDLDGFCRHLEWRFSKYPDELKVKR